MSSSKRISNFLLSSSVEINELNEDIQSVSNASMFSTNYTMSNLVGTGRVLGNLYSSVGRRLERTVGNAAHKAGFGPTATYEKIQELYRTDWRANDTSRQTMRKLCLKLFDFAINSKVDTTIMTAIQQLADLFRSFHDLFLWLDLLDCDEFKNRARKVYFLVEAIPRYMRRRIGSYETTKQIFELHGFGLNLLSLNCVNVTMAAGGLKVNWHDAGRLSESDLEAWDDSLHCVVSGLRNPELSKLSLWYIRLCTGAHKNPQLVQRLHAPLQETLSLCVELTATVGPVDVYSVELTTMLYDFSRALDGMGKKVEAFIVNQHATRICRSLLKPTPETSTIHLSLSLSKLSSSLRDMGKRRDAVAISEMDVAVSRNLAAKSPYTFNANLAASLRHLSLLLRDVDQKPEALSAIEEAVMIYRRIAANHSGTSNADFAVSLDHLIMCLEDAGRKGEAHIVRKEAEEVRELAARTSDVHSWTGPWDTPVP